VLVIKPFPLELSIKPLLLQAARDQATFTSPIKEGDIVPGYISRLNLHSANVSLPGKGVIAIATEFSDSTHDCIALQNNQSVLAHVMRIGKTVKVSLRASKVMSPDLNTALLRNYFVQRDKTEKRANIGVNALVRAKIKEVNSMGATLEVEETYEGIANEFHMEGKTMKVGKKFQGRVIDINVKTQVVDITSRKELVDVVPKETHLLSMDTDVRARIEVVKSDYLVLSLPDYGLIGFSLSKNWNQRHDPQQAYEAGTETTVRVLELPTEETHRILLSKPPTKWEMQQPTESKEEMEE